MDVRVEVRCEDCAADLGRSAPVLIVVARDSWGWELISTGPRRPQARPGPPPLLGGLVAANTAMARAARAVNQHHVRGRSVELACRRCKRHRTRRRRGLCDLAKQAAATGRGVAYLSLR